MHIHCDQNIGSCKHILKPWLMVRKCMQSNHIHTVDPSCNGPTHLDEDVDLHLVDSILSKAQETRLRSLSKGCTDCFKVKQMDTSLTVTDKLNMPYNDMPYEGAESINCKNIVHNSTSRNTQNIPKKLTEQSRHSHTLGRSSKSCDVTLSVHRKKMRNSNSELPIIGATAKSDIGMKSKLISSSKSHSSSGTTTQKVKSAVVVAPFKTDLCLKFPKRNSVKICAFPTNWKTVSSSRHSVCQRRNLAPVKDQSCTLQRQCRTPQDTTSACAPCDHEDCCHEQCVLSEDLSSESLTTVMCSLNVHETEISANDCNINTQAHSNNRIDDGSKSFNLVKDGHTLSIPPRMKQLFKKNEQLRRKISLSMSNKMPKGADIGSEFCKKMQLLFDGDKELLLRHKPFECLHIHEHLSHLLDNLQLESLTDASSTFDILHAKVMAEFVLSEFSSMAYTVDAMSKVSFTQKPKVPDPGLIGHVVLSPSLKCSGSKIFSPYSRLEYTSMKQWQEYDNLLLKLYTLENQHKLLQQLTTNVMPWLEKEDINRRTIYLHKLHGTKKMEVDC